MVKFKLASEFDLEANYCNDGLLAAYCVKCSGLRRTWKSIESKVSEKDEPIIMGMSHTMCKACCGTGKMPIPFSELVERTEDPDDDDGY